MDTTRSTQMARAFLAQGGRFKRKTQTYTRRFSAGPEVVFPQFCPTREMDWITGWKADLVYSDSGYAERDCVFTTPADNILGPGLWVFTGYEPNKSAEIVVIHDANFVQHWHIDLVDKGDGTSEATWTIIFTAINEAGNAVIEAMPDRDPDFDRLIDGLEHFVTTGERRNS